MRRKLLVQVMFFCIALTSCGGGSPADDSIAHEDLPVFTSTPSSAAAEGEEYSYTLSASAREGGAVVFALTRAPDGAALSGNTLSWTPSWEQSRTANQFEITATTTKGAKATQNWSVSPAGTVYVKRTDIYVSADGTEEKVSGDASAIAIYFPSADMDGAVTVPPTSIAEDSTAVFRKVRAGQFYVWKAWQTALWTDKSSIDLGTVMYGRRVDNAASTATLNGTVNGVRSQGAINWLSLDVPNVRATAELRNWGVDNPIDSWSGSFTMAALEGSKGDVAYITEIAGDELYDSVLMWRRRPVAAAQLDGVSAPPDGSANFSTTLSPIVEEQSFGLKLRSSEWTSALNKMHSHGASFSDFSVGLYADPLHVRPNPFPGGQQLLTLDYVGRNLGALPVSDLDLGTFYYGNPYPSAWRTDFFIYATATGHYAVAGTQGIDLAGQVGYVAQTVPGSADLVTPLVRPVGNIRVDGKDATSAEFTINTSTPLVSWTPPPDAPRIAGYVVSLCHVEQDAFGVFCQYAGTVYTTETSITLTGAITPLGHPSSPNMFANVLTVRVITDPDADLVTKPLFRRPTAWADATTQVFYVQR